MPKKVVKKFNSKRVGAGWIVESKKSHFIACVLKTKAGDRKLLLFPNSFKKKESKQPDYNLVLTAEGGG